jgi:hypothetical protein
VDLQQLLNVEQLEGLNLDVMFGAVPKRLVADVSKKFNLNLNILPYDHQDWLNFISGFEKEGSTSNVY